MRSPSYARFYATVNLHPPSALLILGLAVATGVWTISVSPGELDSGLAMLLFVQMFLASSGFLVPARRGHFDPLLMGGRDRTRAVVWHWAVSVAPGVAGWMCLAGTGYVLGSPTATSALLGGRAVALFIVSALAWAVGFTLARGAAGVIWMAALLALLLRRAELLPPSLGLPSAQVVMQQAAVLLACPFLLIGNRLPVEDGAICAAALLSAVVLLAVWRMSGRLDIVLVNRA